MNKFEQYLINDGIHYQVAASYGRIADTYINWLTQQGLTPRNVKKRSQFTKFLVYCKEELGNKKRTLTTKETVVKKYYEFLGTKYNPAHRWKKRKKEHTEPTPALKVEELVKIYDSMNPSSPTKHRDRCIIGLIVFQGLLRQDIEEMRLSDFDLENGEVYIIAKRRTNARKLKLEYKQAMHLYEYIHKYRKDFLAIKTEETDKVFLSAGTGNSLGNAFSILLRQLRLEFPQIEDFTHLRTSVITHWEKEEGIIEAKVKAGHRYVSSTERYQTNKYDELQEELKRMHPLESLRLNY